MKNISKRVLGLLMATLMLFCMMPMSIAAEGDAEVIIIDNSSKTTNVAKVGDKGYESLQEAINACKNGETVKLLTDITYTNADVVNAIGGATGFGQYLNPCIIYVGGAKGDPNTPSSVNAVIDLNGHTIKNTADAYFIMIMDNAKVTFTDSVGGGKVITTADAPAVWVIGTETLVTIKAGYFETASVGGVLHATHGGDLVIEGGEFNTTATNKSLLIMLNSKDRQNSKFFISGVATVTIKNGIFHGFNPSKVGDDNGATSIEDIKFVDGCAEGFVPVQNADGTYGIAVTIGSVEDLLAFANAVTGNKDYQGVKVAANSQAVVLLTADLDLANSGFVGIGNGAANAFSGTFDGQGHTISNMTLSCNYNRGVGFFRSLGKGAVVKNVTFVNANVNNGAATSSNHFYGVVAGFSSGLTLDNVDIKDSTVTCKYSGAAMVGCLEGATVIKNSDIENVTLTTTDIRAAVYGIIGNSANGHSITTENNTVKAAKLSINGEIKPLAETVAYGSWNAGQDYAESTYVAQIGVKKYSTLTAAIKAAQAGDTITLIGNVNGNVTIDKNLTIDGNGKTYTYTGTMTVNDNLTVTVQNVKFVNGGIVKSAKSAKGHYTIKGCTFDGEGKYFYPLSFKGANTITVEDCAVNNYLYSFLYVPSSTNNVSVKDVTVENCPNYAVYFASGVKTASFENLTVKNSNNGFVINNTANRAFTIKNCKMENVGTAINHTNGTNTITCTVLGVNDFGGAALSKYANVIGVQVGTKIYASLAEALAAAKAGDTVTLLGDYEESGMVTIVPAGVVLNLNGHDLTATNLLAFGNVIDNNGTTDGLGGIVISNDRTKAFVQLQQNNTYLPIYDTANGCYRFFYYEIEATKSQATDTSVTFFFRLRLSSVEAHKLLADATNKHGVTISLKLFWDGLTSDIIYTLRDDTVSGWADNMVKVIEDGKTTAMKPNNLSLKISGINKLEGGASVSATPTISTNTGVGGVAESLEYTIPTA